MNRKLATVSSLAIALVLTLACSGNPPPPVDSSVDATESTEPSATDVSPGPAPSTGEDTKPIWDEDINAINIHIVKKGLLPDVYFDFDKYDLKSESRTTLQKNAAFMREHPEFQFGVEGHCDERGTNEYNLALGERRATTAESYLMSLGADGNRIQTISYGEERPSCSDHSENCWQQNRRAHFYVMSRLSAG